MSSGVSDRLNALLDLFRKEEDEYVYTASILAGDKVAHKILSVWSTMSLSWTEPKTTPPSEKSALWDWIWTGVDIKLELISERTGIDAYRVRRIFETMRASRLMYPDGTLTEHAASSLKAEFLRSLKMDRGDK